MPILAEMPLTQNTHTHTYTHTQHYIAPTNRTVFCVRVFLPVVREALERLTELEYIHGWRAKQNELERERVCVCGEEK